MPWLTPGHAYALLTAVNWAVAVILFRRSGEEIAPFALNYFKNVVAIVLLLVSLPFVGGVFSGAGGWREALVLMASGALGIGVADTLFLRSLNILGASRSAIVDCLYSPSVVLFSFLLLGERLSSTAALGAALVVSAVLTLAIRRRSQAVAGGRLVEGVLLGALSMALMAFSIVGVKPLLERETVFGATTLRMLGGVASLTLVAIPSARWRREIRGAFRPAPVWRYAIPGSVAGTYVALLFWVAGFKYAPANIASILNQTSTLFVVLLAAVFLREPLTPRRIVAVAMGFVGSVLALR